MELKPLQRGHVWVTALRQLIMFWTDSTSCDLSSLFWWDLLHMRYCCKTPGFVIWKQNGLQSQIIIWASHVFRTPAEDIGLKAHRIHIARLIFPSRPIDSFKLGRSWLDVLGGLGFCQQLKFQIDYSGRFELPLSGRLEDLLRILYYRALSCLRFCLSRTK